MNIKKTYSNFVENPFDIFDTVQSIYEIYYCSKLIKKLCKRENIDQKFQDMYLKIQRDILNTVNDKNVRNSKEEKLNEELVNELYPVLISGRLYELSYEFPRLIRNHFYHAANALTRQLVEIYLRILFLKVNPNYKKDFLKNLNYKFPTTKEIVDKLKKSNLEFNYITGIGKDKFLEGIYIDFKHFSNLFHPSPLSFASNVWILNEDGSTILYVESPNMVKDKKLLVFSKKSYIPVEQKKHLIHQFYTYSGFILKELEFMNK